MASSELEPSSLTSPLEQNPSIYFSKWPRASKPSIGSMDDRLDRIDNQLQRSSLGGGGGIEFGKKLVPLSIIHPSKHRKSIATSPKSQIVITKRSDTTSSSSPKLSFTKKNSSSSIIAIDSDDDTLPDLFSTPITNKTTSPLLVTRTPVGTKRPASVSSACTPNSPSNPRVIFFL